MESSVGRRGRSVMLLNLLVVILAWLSSHQEGQVSAHVMHRPPYHPPYYPHYQPSPSYPPYHHQQPYGQPWGYVIDSLARRVDYLTSIIYDLAKQECQTGTFEMQYCPGFYEATTEEIIQCVVGPKTGDGPNITDVTINFADEFDAPPVLEVTVVPTALVSAKNCSVEVVSVTKESFTAKVVSDNFLPIVLNLSYYACPSALFDDDDK